MRAARVIDRLDRVNLPPRRCVDRAANAVIADAPGGTPRIRNVVELSGCRGSWISSMIRSCVGSTIDDHDRLLGPDEVIQQYIRHRPGLARLVVVALVEVKSREASDEYHRA